MRISDQCARCPHGEVRKVEPLTAYLAEEMRQVGPLGWVCQRVRMQAEMRLAQGSSA